MTRAIRDPGTLARVILAEMQGGHIWRGRSLVALAGPPAVGKSTLAAALVEALNENGTRAQLVPMDGFHLDNGVLAQRNLLLRKGAPETFDLQGLQIALSRLRSGEEVILPSFDRSLDRSIAGSIVVGTDIDVVVVEGNYLAFDADGWRELISYWQFSVRLRATRQVLQNRLIQRWLDHGLDPDAAERRAFQNDIPNAMRIFEAELPTSLLLDV
ncbi:MAG: nucleoside/nucleotide kinase family protein [Rhodobacteraceae bacterium]|nr:nucleoside/nucleotide kinase family protein [Paracoccaceae bacterium]